MEFSLRKGQLLTLLCFLLTVTLSGCGGEDNENDQDNDTQTSSDADSRSGAGTDPGEQPGDEVSGGCINSTTLENEIIQRVNQARGEARNCGSEPYPAVAGVSWDERLEGAALTHSEDMASNNFFSHTGSDSSSVGDRATMKGYSWSHIGENIAAGQTTIEAVVTSWLNSPGHCTNIMNTTYTNIGVSCADDASSEYGRYWTMVLARPAD